MCTGACVALALTSHTSRCGQPTSFANPPHRICSAAQDVAHALAVQSRQCFQVLDARASSLSLSRRCGDQPASLMHFSSACWIFHQPPPLAFSPVSSSCFSCTSRFHGIVFRCLRRARPHFRLLVGAATNPSFVLLLFAVLDLSPVSAL